MAIRVGINGFGRIGRNIMRAIYEAKRNDIEIVGINDLGPVETNAHLLRFDSVHGRFPGEVTVKGDTISLGNGAIKVTAERDPSKLPWKGLGVEIVIESTGFFTKPELARQHIQAGAKKVVISAPAKGEGADTIVLGVNENKLASAGGVVSNASCTTNCITPVAAVVESTLGIEKAMMTTVHSYTASQALQDGPAKDLREARAAAENIVPTTTGATTRCRPSLAGTARGFPRFEYSRTYARSFAK